MRFLIIGRGSMSSRRQRNLKALGYNDFITYDITDKESIEDVFESYKPDAVIVSSPPLTKQKYIALANANNVPVFAEADITSYSGYEYYPSRTMVYHPAIKKIKEMLDNNELGDVYTFNYRLGQRLTTWHKDADYSKYYAAKKKTSGVFEMIVFEIAWLTQLFGTPISAKGTIEKQLNIPKITADDVCASVVSFGRSVPDWKWFRLGYRGSPDDTITGTILIDTVALPAARELTIIGEKGTLVWSWTKGTITMYATDGAVSEISIQAGEAAEGYHPAIAEQMYVNEIKAFIGDVSNKANFTSYGYTPEDEAEVIKMLHEIRGDKK